MLPSFSNVFYVAASVRLVFSAGTKIDLAVYIVFGYFITSSISWKLELFTPYSKSERDSFEIFNPASSRL